MNCPLCDASAKNLAHSESREYQLCELCKLIFVPPTFHIPVNEEVARYLEHENSLDNEGYVEMFAKKIALVKTHCPPLKTALDFGCGYEPVLKTLLEKEGMQTEVYDHNFFPDINANKTYDLVISTETFEHFRNPKEDIQLAANCVSSGGILAVMTRFYPITDGELSKEDFSKWYYKRDPTHILFYTSHTFQWLAENLGFQIIFDNQFDFVLLRKPFPS